ncbi:MAG TPA: histidine kinase dimerization/phospho-acceptor domain-containing protein, partial [Rectinemataceae bacterium]|nr:histidine kinase dimerization/phospho-acceptor domain-containing protein [Rectinemataceae bacterium]
MIYPVAQNEAVATGTLKNLLQDQRPGVRADIDEAIATGGIVLSGPYELRQGGLGLVARKALYDRGSFWGLTVIVLDMPPLLRQSGIDPPASPRLRIGLKDKSGQIVAGESSLFDADPIIIDVGVAGQVWRLAGLPSGGWFGTYKTSLRSFQALGLFAAILFAGLVYTLSNQGMRLRDAVDKKTAALRESEGRLKEAQRLGRIGSWEYDLETKLIHWSDEVFVLYGRDQALGPPSVEEEASYYSTETFRRLSELTNAAATEGKSFFYDFQAKLPDGSLSYFSWSVRTERDGTGKIVKLFGTVQDIAERKRAEKEIQKLNEGLEGKVAERTLQLEETNKELEAFTYSVSHDLRAPLRAINGFSGILVEDYGATLDDEGRRICSVISRSAQNMGDLID